MDYNTILKYLQGKTSARESEIIRSWLKNPENEVRSRKILGDIWNNSEIKLKGAAPDFKAMFQSIYQQVEHHEYNFIQLKTNRFTRFFAVFSKIAAVLVLPLLMGFFYLYITWPQDNNSLVSSSLIQEVYTKPGTRSKIQLSDGTLVWLNDGTTFRYPDHFGTNNREVYLDGEAYFEVKADSEHPFVIDNPMMKTKVTGTHFNLNAYSADNFYEATLLEGEISLMRDNQMIPVAPGEQVLYNVELNKFSRQEMNAQDANAWINGQLIFKDEKLGTVIRRLGRWFNVEFITTDPEIDDFLLSGTFEDEKLNQVLDMISFAIPVKFDVQKSPDSRESKRTIYVMED